MLQGYRMYIQLFVALIVMLIGTCNSSIETICRRELDNDMKFNIICTCNNVIKDFEVIDEDSYFIDSKSITIKNCKTATLQAGDFTTSTDLEQLRLQRIQMVELKLFLPSKFSSLEIEDVGNLTGLPNHIFSHVHYLHNLVIKNTNVQSIDSHTFSDVVVKNIQFINTTFKYLKSNALNFRDSQQNSTFRIERCTFEKLDVNAVSVERLSTVQILKSEFKGIFDRRTFNISTKTVLLESNTFTCSKRDDTCNDITFGIVESLYGFTRHNPRDMCKLLQMNFCNSRKTKSLIRSLRYCYPNLLKYGVGESCVPLESDGKGYNIYPNINLYLVYVLVLKLLLL